MTRVCKRCGVKFTPHTKAQFMCPECAKAARAEALLRARTLKCVRCGIEFEARAGAQYCRDCAREVQREHNTRYKREGAARKLGSVDYCQRCGKEYTVVGGAQKYCPDCKEAARKSRKREHTQDQYYNHGRKEKLREIKNRIKKDSTVCPVCGKIFSPVWNQKIYCSPECAQKADELGLNIGTRPSNKIAGRPPTSRNTSGVRGVHWDKKARKYVAKLTVHGKLYQLGEYKTLEEAAAARKAGEEKYCPKGETNNA